MNNLNNLRPEVADAVSALDETTCMTNPGLKWYATIRAELLRLVKENRILEIKNRGTLANNLCSDHRDKQAGRPCLVCLLEHAEAELAAALKANRDCVDHFEQMQAELAALKARIADAPVGVFGLCYNGHEPGFLGFPQAIDNLPRESMLGKRIRLIVEE